MPKDTLTYSERVQLGSICSDGDHSRQTVKRRDERIDVLDEVPTELLSGRRLVQFAPARNRLQSGLQHVAEEFLHRADESFGRHVQRPHQHVLSAARQYDSQS